VSPRNPTPTTDPIVERLGDPQNLPDAEDVIKLIGFVGPGRPGSFRIHPDGDLQRWLEVPEGAIVDSQQIDPGNELGRSVIWVDRQTMMQPILDEDVIEEVFAQVKELLGPAPLSIWNLIPETRLDVADLLDLVPYEGEEEGEYS
jgi:hypothetical protein